MIDMPAVDWSIHVAILLHPTHHPHYPHSYNGL
jgi:hypothetical protein